MSLISFILWRFPWYRRRIFRRRLQQVIGETRWDA